MAAVGRHWDLACKPVTSIQLWPGLAVYEGELVAAGKFDTAGDVACNNIALWNGSGWQPIGGGITGGLFHYVASLAEFDGDLIVGGYFKKAGDEACNSIARWDGNSWHALRSGVGHGSAQPTVADLAIYDGKLIAGGIFTTASGVTVNHIACWHDGTWQSIEAGVAHDDADAYVEALAISDGGLVAGGGFTSAGDVPCVNIGFWTECQSLPLPESPDSPADGDTSEDCVLHDLDNIAV